MTSADTIFQCPVTGRPLRRQNDVYIADGGAISYPTSDGIALLVPDAKKSSTASSVIDWYDSFGWLPDTDGKCKETNLVAGRNRAQITHTSRCISRLGKYFAKGGEFIVDVGSGAIPHDELLDYGRGFNKRICVDLSITGLRQAKKKLGDGGIYVLGDATKLPLANETADAITCNHLIYQLPVALQRAAILEIWRVLKPGGVAVIVYRWLHSGIQAKLEQIASRSGIGKQTAEVESQPDQVPQRDHDDPQLRRWFEDQEWPFEYSYDCFRLVDLGFMRKYVNEDWRGQLFLNALFTMQRCFPSLCGRYGLFPAIIIRKPLAS